MKESRGEHRKKWAAEHGLAAKPSMERRKDSHNYYGRCIYMITIVTEGRRPLLGELQAADAFHPQPWVKCSPLGSEVLRLWQVLPVKYPEIKTIGFQLMPDHVHGIVFVTREMRTHLGNVVAWFKKESNAISTSMTGGSLWKSGFNDVVLQRDGQLARMVEYLRDNPRRLWLKRNNADFFTIHRSVAIGGETVATVGNQFLLGYPIKAVVQCSRRISTPDAIRHEVDKYLTLARHGAVLISPCISPAEKAVMRAAYDANHLLIVLMENGFSPLWKPGGRQFDACAEGRLLLVAPWPHHNQRTAITRQQCLRLNELSREIANL